MPAELLDWVEAAHIFGVILWTGGLFACLRLLKAHAAGGGDAAAETARSTALVMDAGATVAIAAGLTMALTITPSPFRQGWLHAKLVLVVLGVLAIHGLTRAKLKKARSGAHPGVPAFLAPVAIAIVAVIVALAVAKPF